MFFLGFLGVLRILEKGFDLETPKKYTFALEGFHWVFICIDFSKIAVLFFCRFSFFVFLHRFCIFDVKRNRKGKNNHPARWTGREAPLLTHIILHNYDFKSGGQI